jgi:hypothetical protein
MISTEFNTPRRFLARSVLARWGIKTRRYQIGALALELNQEHKLLEYQGGAPCMTVFFRCCAGNLQAVWVIDIGANVGDTVISIAPEFDGPLRPKRHILNY